MVDVVPDSEKVFCSVEGDVGRGTQRERERVRERERSEDGTVMRKEERQRREIKEGLK